MNEFSGTQKMRHVLAARNTQNECKVFRVFLHKEFRNLEIAHDCSNRGPMKIY